MPLAGGLYYSLSEGGKRDQKPVVLIHGAGSSHLCWPAELRRLNGYTVYAIDLPGHGRSQGVGFQSVAAYCGAIIDFLAALDLYRAHFVGHSLGGAIALNLALDYGQHVEGLGLIASGAHFDLPADMLDYLSSPTSAPVGLQILQQHSFSAKARPDLVNRSLEALKATRSSVLYGDWTACAQFDVRARAAEVTAPAYIAAGSQDRLTPPAQSRFLAGSLPNARLEVIAEAGHLVMLEQPAAVAHGLRAFLEQVSSWQANISLPVEIKKQDRARLQSGE